MALLSTADDGTVFVAKQMEHKGTATSIICKNSTPYLIVSGCPGTKNVTNCFVNIWKNVAVLKRKAGNAIMVAEL